MGLASEAANGPQTVPQTDKQNCQARPISHSSRVRMPQVSSDADEPVGEGLAGWNREKPAIEALVCLVV